MCLEIIQGGLGAMRSAMSGAVGLGVCPAAKPDTKLTALCPLPACEQEGSWPLVGFPY